MCGRYVVSPDEKWRPEFDRVFPKRLPLDWWPEASYNVAPTQEVPVLFLDDKGNPTFGPMRWGLVPHWVKPDVGLKYATRFSTINARSETVAEKPTFRSSFKRRRAIMPASGFYEWLRGGEHKRPFYHLRGDGRPLMMAALWDRWDSPEGERFQTCSLITTSAAGKAAEIHDRMPVVLHSQDYGTWLAPDTPPETLHQLMLPWDGPLDAYEVDRRMNTPRNNDPRCIENLTYEA